MEIYFSKLKLFVYEELGGINRNNYMTYRTKIIDLLEHATFHAARHDVDIKAIDSARFAMCAYLDEKIMEFDGLRNQWMNVLLQQKYYNTNLAGHLFFKKLYQDMKMGRVSARVYWWCLLAGYKGKYGGIDRGIEKIMSDIYQHIDALPRPYQQFLQLRIATHADG